MDLDPSRLVTCASGWTDHPVGHVLDVHVYPGPTNGGTGNIPLYSRPTNGETGNIPVYSEATNGGTGNIPRSIQDQPMGKQVTFHIYPGPTNGETGNIPRLSRTDQWGNR
jgi:hypothetical protein